MKKYDHDKDEILEACGLSEEVVDGYANKIMSVDHDTISGTVEMIENALFEIIRNSDESQYDFVRITDLSTAFALSTASCLATAKELKTEALEKIEALLRAEIISRGPVQ